MISDRQLRSLQVDFLIDYLGDFYEPAEARRWVFAPQELLGGASPIELFRSGEDNKVMDLIDRLHEAGHH